MSTLTPDLLLRSRTLLRFATELNLRLRTGSHLILRGPRGSGKSALLSILRSQNQVAGVPCGTSEKTSGIRDVVSALAQAYPDVAAPGSGKRVTRARLRLAADEAAGVVLLDHATDVTTAMLGYLRRLRGGLVGALLVCDVDSLKERDRYRAWHTGALTVRMPLMPVRILGSVLTSALKERQLPPLDARVARQLVHAAHGRIGWLTACTEKMCSEKYWRDGQFRVAALCIDTEIFLRESRPGPRP